MFKAWRRRRLQRKYGIVPILRPGDAITLAVWIVGLEPEDYDAIPPIRKDIAAGYASEGVHVINWCFLPATKETVQPPRITAIIRGGAHGNDVVRGGSPSVV